MIYLVYLEALAVLALTFGFATKTVKLRKERLRADALRDISDVAMGAHKLGRRLVQRERQIIEKLRAKL